jgi:hypothetical protein
MGGVSEKLAWVARARPMGLSHCDVSRIAQNLLHGIAVIRGHPVYRVASFKIAQYNVIWYNIPRGDACG